MDPTQQLISQLRNQVETLQIELARARGEDVPAAAPSAQSFMVSTPLLLFFFSLLHKRNEQNQINFFFFSRHRTQ
jgi:hypothetical protein